MGERKFHKRKFIKASASKGKETGPKCKFYKKHGHIHRECPKFREWLDNKGIPFKKQLQKGERIIKVGNGDELHVEAIGTLLLVLEGGFNLYLNNTLYVPLMTQNLISVSKLDRFGYDFKFGHNCLEVYFDSHVVGTGSLENDLYKLHLENNMRNPY
ncbi:uncharacterized protein [Rutidosis leptorrhynchoides]|uniref:uncharacterized protein n=1 Tax=Rutidosis leptorrhynchoides TaxID=125765 RepID=UPI003A996588